ncbi:MAG: hypothetical protein AAF268_06755 [Cyanobacteria bacterium P01_A01_bin.3]
MLGRCRQGAAIDPLGVLVAKSDRFGSRTLIDRACYWETASAVLAAAITNAPS